MFNCFQRTFAVAVIIVIIHGHCSSAANILIFCLPSFSQIVGPANVGKVLRDQGHNVTVVIPPILQVKVAEMGLNHLLYYSLEDFDVIKEADKIIFDGLRHGKSPLFLLAAAIDFIKQGSERILRDEQLLEDIKAHKPDLMILTSVPPARMLTIIPYKLDVPFTFIGTIAPSQFTRTPILPSVVPSYVLDVTDHMSFSQRIINTFVELLFYFYDPFSNPTAVRDYAPEKPYISLRDLQAKALLWLVDQHVVLDYSPPALPNVKYVGHLIGLEAKPLAERFQDFVNSAKEGVVIVSFGSILKSVPRETFDKFLTAFEQTKYKFVVRYSTPNSSNSDQFLFSDWLPQYDLLLHTNTRLLITHCGANSLQEAVFAGVPMIGFPVMADQPHNAAKIVRKGFGLRLDLSTFNEQDLVSAIEEVITNPKYKTQTKKASAIMRAEIVPPVEEAAFWINHILTFGADHLRSSGQEIPLWQYLGLDVLAFCLLVWHVILFVFVKLLRLSFHWFCKRKEKLKAN